MNRTLGAALGGLVLLALAGCGGETVANEVTSPATAAATPTTAPPTTTSPAPTTTAPTAVAPATTAEPVTTVPATTAPAIAPGPVVRSGADASPDQLVGDPLSIVIPEIGVASPLVATGVLADGTVDVPASADIAGWFTGGPRPGERGPAVVMGHVDSRATGPGVFYRLAELTVGAIATVETTTGPEHFVVRSVEQYPKDQFPTDLVYGAEPGATLRLITCGGSFDDSIRHYRDNIVAFLVRTDV